MNKIQIGFEDRLRLGNNLNFVGAVDRSCIWKEICLSLPSLRGVFRPASLGLDRLRLGNNLNFV